MDENFSNNQYPNSYYPEEMNFDSKTMSFSKKEPHVQQEQKNMSSPFSNMNFSSLFGSLNNPEMLTKILGNKNDSLTSLLSNTLTNNTSKTSSKEPKEKSLNTKDSFEEI
ncbi:MAG: hypothetical protein K2K31_02100 [Clostridia bacterium]|nr:hypothetical protein [Clostridia bacterium]